MGNEEGRISEWNEGNFKSIRLHEIQDSINKLRLNPLMITEGKFNYIWLIHNIDILCGEGYSKYSKTERKEVDEIQELLYQACENLPPTLVVENEGIAGKEKTFTVHKERYQKLMELITIFERKVKDYNDKHGLTSPNKEEHGGWN